jgi:hypothetical protein
MVANYAALLLKPQWMVCGEAELFFSFFKVSRLSRPGQDRPAVGVWSTAIVVILTNQINLLDGQS